jgi:formamidopyrimidine-DNA glycosylase
MPELPEVETIVRTLRPQVENRRITRVLTLLPRVLQAGGELLPALGGGVIRAVRRRAKLLLLDVEAREPLLMAFHLKMTGRFFVYPEGTEPQKHTRLIVDLEAERPAQGGGMSRLFFDDMRTFGYCRVMRPADLAFWKFYAALGPEPLETPAEELAARFALKGRSASIKAVLLDQSVVAGVGNIYADESLFRAGIAPAARASGLAPERLLPLAQALQGVLRQSVEECGSSIRDYRDALGNAGAFQNSFAVYGKKGGNCPACGTALVSSRVAGRGTTHCPRCQCG